MGHKNAVVAAYATTALGVSGVSLLAPVLPELAARYGVDVEAMALFQTAVMVPGILTAALAGALAPRVGLAPVLRSALLIYGFGGISLLVVDSYPLALLLRLVQGVGGGGLVAMSFLLIARAGPGQRLAATGRNAAVISTMMLLQPLLGSSLGAISPVAPCAFYGLAIVAAMVVPGLASAQTAPPVQHYRRSTRIPGQVMWVLIMTVVLNILLFGWLLLLTPLVLDAAGVGISARGWTLALQSGLATVVTLAVARWREAGRFRLLLISGWAIGASILLGSSLGPSELTIPLLIAAGTFYGAVNPTLVSSLSGAEGGRWLGWWQSSARLGQVIGPVLAGTLYADIGGGPTLAIGGVLAALVLAVAILYRRPHHASTRPMTLGN
ncbi:MFS transporter [Georgenia subflava]|uniref:MFS transporter n=1 Tax=Georgenia subflava TaxID=1622177 RepID=A0A6N7EFR3_9MICO|nr:MFS transporter [Georgenia subflava]MPV35507.1 MFS transporter [Georgenia subflava]